MVELPTQKRKACSLLFIQQIYLFHTLLEHFNVSLIEYAIQGIGNNLEPMLVSGTPMYQPDKFTGVAFPPDNGSDDLSQGHIIPLVGNIVA